MDRIDSGHCLSDGCCRTNLSCSVNWVRVEELVSRSSRSRGSVSPFHFVQYGGLVWVTPFEWLVPKRQTWVFSNIPEYSMLWFSKVMLVAMIIAWRREQCTRRLDWVTVMILFLVLLDSWAGRKFPGGVPSATLR
jgi:hypothetical protein